MLGYDYDDDDDDGVVRVPLYIYAFRQCYYNSKKVNFPNHHLKSQLIFGFNYSSMLLMIYKYFALPRVRVCYFDDTNIYDYYDCGC